MIKRTTPNEISNYLKHTGFIFEMEVVAELNSLGYKTVANGSFLDLEENKKREMDILARKEVNGINVMLVSECKMSLVEDWVFVFSEPMTPRYYFSTKHSPVVDADTIRELKVFDSLPNLNRRFPLAQNYLAFDKTKGKKVDPLAIQECIYKLPKEVIYEASSRWRKGRRNLFFPIAFFSGDIFLSSYKRQVKTKRIDFAQYAIEFNPDAYKYKAPKPEVRFNTMASYRTGSDYAQAEEDKKVESIKRASDELGRYYTINFVAGGKIKSFIDKLEAAISKIKIEDWKADSSK